jgi:glycosyltransferase involved in cell wall biosynthesis
MFIGSLTGGGAERVICNLANFLIEKGHQATIITNVEADGFYAPDSRIGRYVLLYDKERKNPLFNFLHCMKRLKKYVTENSSDHYVVFLPLTTVMLLSLRKKISGRILVSERGDPEQNSKLMKFFLKKWISRADGVVFQTEVAKAWYEPYLKKAENVVIPNAINPAFIRPKYEGERDKVIIGAGRLNDQKNFSLLISSFARIAEKFPEYKLVIYGKGSLLESLQNLAKEKGVGDQVEFPGYVPDMPEILEKASMFVLSSDYEGMPNALMEAMALGVPCVSTDCGGGGARFLIQDSVNGLLVPIQDEDAMAQAMEKILNAPEMAAKLGENGRKLQQTLAPEKIYGEWEAFIKETVSRSKEGMETI